jgi:hypothetical protein
VRYASFLGFLFLFSFSDTATAGPTFTAPLSAISDTGAIVRPLDNATIDYERGQVWYVFAEVSGAQSVSFKLDGSEATRDSSRPFTSKPGTPPLGRHEMVVRARARDGSTNTRRPTFTIVWTKLPTPTLTPTATPAPTPTPTPVSSPSPTITPPPDTPTPTATASEIPSPTPAETATVSPTSTPIVDVTASATVSPTSAPTSPSPSTTATVEVSPAPSAIISRHNTLLTFEPSTSSNVTGYQLQWGSKLAQIGTANKQPIYVDTDGSMVPIYTDSRDIGQSTLIKLNLPDTQRRYYSVFAYDATGDKSGASNIISVPP